MSKRIKILQLSDIHISLNKNDYKKVNIVDNFLFALKEGLKSNPDFIVLSGDLSFENGNDEVYKWVKSKLDKTKLPYYINSGNHDENKLLKKYFKTNPTNNKLYYSFEYKDNTFIILDSGSGIISQEQIDWLLDLDKNIKQDIYIFMHHPPIITGCNYMDINYPLKNMPVFQKILKQLNNVKAIFCGHYHIEQTIISTPFNIPVYVCPSTWYEMNKTSPTFKANNYKPRWYEIDIYNHSLKVNLRSEFCD